MRKSRKVIADIAASPPIPPSLPPQPQATSQNPHCLFCKRDPARFLNYLHAKEEPTAFCCTICAASYALTHVKRRCLMWCNQHNLWTDDNGECRQCWILTEAARRDAYIKAMPADEKAVDSGN